MLNFIYNNGWVSKIGLIMARKNVNENITKSVKNVIKNHINETVSPSSKVKDDGSFTMRDISNNTVDLNEGVYLPHEIPALFQEYRTGFNLDYQVLTGRLDLIVKYRNISLFPEVMTAVDEIVTSAVVMANGKPFEIQVNEIVNNNEIRNMFIHEFNNFLVTQNINKTIYEIFEQWFIDGILYVWRRVDQTTHKTDYYIIDPLQIKLELNKWIVTIPSLIQQSPVSMMFQPAIQYSGYDNSLMLEIPFNEISVYYSGKYHNRIPIGYLHKALKSANQLNLLKDAILVYRLSRSAEKLVFYIDVGQIPKKDAEAYINNVASKYRNQKYYNPATGDIDGKVAIQSMLHSYFIARQEGKTTEISTVGGNIQLGDVEDFKIFINELYKSLYVPRTRMANTTEESGTHGLINNIQEIQIEEKRFFKFLQRVRSNFQIVYIDMFRDFLVMNGKCTWDEFESYRNFISLKFFNDIEVEQIMFYADLQQKLTMLGSIKDFMAVDNMHFFSTEWVCKNIFGWSDEQIINMMIGINKDKNSSFYSSKGKVDPDLTIKKETKSFSDVEPFDINSINRNYDKTDYTNAFKKPI